MGSIPGLENNLWVIPDSEGHTPVIYPIEGVIRTLDIREIPNSTFPLITEIFGEITSNFKGLSQITALSKLPQITPS
jgi:hypothetical protein